jgi:hypothetical protein
VIWDETFALANARQGMLVNMRNGYRLPLRPSLLIVLGRVPSAQESRKILTRTTRLPVVFQRAVRRNCKQRSPNKERLRHYLTTGFGRILEKVGTEEALSRCDRASNSATRRKTISKWIRLKSPEPGWTTILSWDLRSARGPCPLMPYYRTCREHVYKMSLFTTVRMTISSCPVLYLPYASPSRSVSSDPRSFF